MIYRRAVSGITDRDFPACLPILCPALFVFNIHLIHPASHVSY